MEALYRIFEGFWFSPSVHIMTSLFHFEEKIDKKAPQQSRDYSTVVSKDSLSCIGAPKFSV